MIHHLKDVQISTDELILTEAGGVMLCDAVAHGKLFLLNANGQMETVTHATYWIGNSLLTVLMDGYEVDEDGEITRDWRPSKEG